MATEIEKLILAVESEGTDKANKFLDQFDKKTQDATASSKALKKATEDTSAALSHQGNTAEKAATQVEKLSKHSKETKHESEGLFSSFFFAELAAKGVELLVEGVVELSKKVIEVGKDFDIFQARLNTTVGSAEKGKEAFHLLDEFVQSTSLSVKEAGNAFITLVNSGLTPSERALRAYGDIAVKTGRSLGEVVDVISAAADGQVRGLNRIGVQAKKDGDFIQLTYLGTRTTVKNSASAIEGYLIKLGENNFAGAMAAKAKTLTGVLSALQEKVELVFLAIARAGPEDALTKGVLAASAVIDDFTARIASGEYSKRVESFGLRWGLVARDIKEAMDLGISYVKQATSIFLSLFDANLKATEDEFTNLPLVIHSVYQKIILATAKVTEDIRIEFQASLDKTKDYFELLGDVASTTFQRIKQYAGGDFSTPGVVEQVTKVNDLHERRKKIIEETAQEALSFNESVYNDGITAIDEETKARHDASEKAIKDAQKLAIETDKAATAHTEKHGAGLGQFKKATGNDGENDAALKKAAADAAKLAAIQKRLLQENLSFLEQGLTTENEVVSASYKLRKDQILADTKTTNDQKKDLILQALAESLITEEQSIRESYQTRRDFILSDTLLTEDAKTSLLLRLTKARDKQLLDLELAKNGKQLEILQQALTNAASATAAFGKKGFEISKGIAIASATIATYLAATRAYKEAVDTGGPYATALGVAAAAAAVAAGLANIAQIKAQKYQGAYALGGTISAGKYGIVGEAGPEIVRGPAVVTSASSTANQSNSSGIRTVTVHNNGQPVQASSQMNGDELMIILEPILAKHKRETKHEIAAGISTGGDTISQRLEKTYSLQRNAT